MKVDMSAEAIDRRLRAVSDLRDLYIRLEQFTVVMPQGLLRKRDVLVAFPYTENATRTSRLRHFIREML